MNLELKYLVSGYISGSISNFITYPLDTLKVWRQSNKKLDMNIKSLYRGVLYPTLTIGITNSLLFFTFENNKKYFQNNYLNGAISGGFNSLLLNPIEIYKVNKQVNNNNFKLIFIRGLHMTILRESVACSFYFGSYYKLKEEGFNSFISGGLAGAGSWIVSYPLDVIKTRIQTQNLSTLNSFKIGNLWVGLGFCCLKSAISNSILFNLYEKCNKYIHIN